MASSSHTVTIWWRRLKIPWISKSVSSAFSFSSHTLYHHHDITEILLPWRKIPNRYTPPYMSGSLHPGPLQTRWWRCTRRGLVFLKVRWRHTRKGKSRYSNRFRFTTKVMLLLRSVIHYSQTLRCFKPDKLWQGTFDTCEKSNDGGHVTPLLSSVSTCASASTPVRSRSDSLTRLIAE